MNKGNFLKSLIAVAGLFVLAAPAQAVIVRHASSVDILFRGDPTLGDFPGFYGGNFPGSFPVELTAAQATAAVLGPADGFFLSLPGDNNTPSGSPIEDAFVAVSFGQIFWSSNDVIITELGNNQESARIFLFLAGGGNIQFNVTRGADDDILIDLGAFAGFGPFVGIGVLGLDENGASQGFDLDAVAIVPEPGTIALLSIGLVALGFSRRRKTT